MNGSNREHELIRYFSAQELSEEKVEAILATLQPRLAAKNRRSVLLAALAVCLLLASFAILRYVGGDGSEHTDGKHVAAERGDPSRDGQSVSRYRFVAVRSHDDRCPGCQATGKMFADFRTHLSDRAIEFEQLELQKDEQLESAMKRAEELQLVGLVTDKDETAFGLLLSDDGAIVLQFDPTESLSHNRQRLLSAIDP